jgi:hypothetical protein
MAGPLAGAAFVMPIAGLNRKHVRAPDYPGAWKKKAGADGTSALALRRAIGGRAMQAPALGGRQPHPKSFPSPRLSPVISE